MQNRKTIGLLLLSLSAIIVVYYSLIRPEIPLIYEGNSVNIFSDLINTIYPRFEIESQRLPLEFFVEKADQILIRLVLSSLFALMTWIWINKKGTYNKVSIKVIKWVLFGFLIYTCIDWQRDLHIIQSYSAFFKPTSFYGILHEHLPGVALLTALNVACILSVTLVLIGYKEKLFIILSTLLFIYLQGLFYCFEKLDHGYTTFTYAITLFTAGVILNNIHYFLHMMKVMVAFMYFQCGVEKLLNSGFSWFNGQSLGIHIEAAELPTFFYSTWILSIIATLVILFQLSFGLILFKPKWGIYYLIFGLLFHISIKVMMGIGAYLHPWYVVYILFLPKEKLNYLINLFNRKGIKKAPTEIEAENQITSSNLDVKESRQFFKSD